jgi:hypothetical protein
MEDFEIYDNGERERAPINGTEFPWKYQLDYKAGKTPAATLKMLQKENPEKYANGPSADMAGAKFHFYDKEITSKVDFDLPATLIICDVYSGIGGTAQIDEKYSNFFSTKVRDSRNEPMTLWQSGIQRPLMTGIYSQIKADLPKGAHFQLYLLCLDTTSKKPFLLTLTSTLQEQLKRAISDRTSAKPDKINLFGLCDISTKWWYIQMNGQFEKVNEKGLPYPGEGDMYFAPVMKAGVFHADSNPEASAMCEEIRNTSSEYIQSTQDRIWKAETTVAAPAAEAPAPAVTAPPMNWPAAPPVVEQVPDDLPF